MHALGLWTARPNAIVNHAGVVAKHSDRGEISRTNCAHEDGQVKEHNYPLGMLQSFCMQCFSNSLSSFKECPSGIVMQPFEMQSLIK